MPSLALRHPPFLGAREITYIASDFEGENLFDIGPDVAIAGERGAQVIQRLPCQQAGSVLRPVQKGPVHRLEFPDDLGRSQQIVDDGFRGQRRDGWIARSRNEVLMW